MIAKKKSFECFVCRCATVEERERDLTRFVILVFQSLSCWPQELPIWRNPSL